MLLSFFPSGRHKKKRSFSFRHIVNMGRPAPTIVGQTLSPYLISRRICIYPPPVKTSSGMTT